MNLLVALVGWLIVVIGVFGAARPHLMIGWVLSWPADIRFYATVATRVLLGLLLIFAAPKCRWPRFMVTIGVITLLAAVIYFVIGPARLESIIQQMSAQPSATIQFLYLIAIVFGGLLIYSSSPRSLEDRHLHLAAQLRGRAVTLESRGRVRTDALEHAI